MNWLDRLAGVPSTLVVLRYAQLAGAGQVSAAELDWQLAMLGDHARPLPLSDVGLYLRGRAGLPRRGVAVTFDAGDERTLSIASDALLRHGLHGTFFVTPEELKGLAEHRDASAPAPGRQIDVGSRTVSGQPLRGRPLEEMRNELLQSRLRIEQMTDQPCTAAAYPGIDDGDERAVLAESGLAGYRLAVSRREGLNALATLEPFALRRVTIATGMSREAFRAALKTGRGVR